MLIQDTLSTLANLPFCVEESATILDVTDTMLKNKNGFVVFVKDKKVTGILTEKDLLKYININSNYEELAYKYATKNVITFQSNRNVEFVLISLLEHDIRRAVILDEEDNYLGVTTHEHLVHYLDNDVYKTKMNLSNLDNLHELHTIDYNTNIQVTLDEMRDKETGSIIITQDNNPVGILTERDVIRLINSNTNLMQSVQKVMSSPIISTDINETIENTLQKMQNQQIQRIVVKDGNHYKLLELRDILQSVKSNYFSLVEKKLQYSKGVLNSISEAIIEVEQIEGEYIIKWCNQKAIDIFERTIIDVNIESLLTSTLWENIKEKIINNETNFKYKFHKGDFTYQITCICDRSTKHNIRLVFMDITEFENLHNSLQQKIEEKTKTLQIMNELLEEDMKKGLEENRRILSKLHKQEKLASMGEMIGNIAHHWRQPLSVISTSSTGIVLHHQLGTIDTQDLIKTCNKINESAQFLSQTINDFSKFLNFNEEESQIDMSELINGAIEHTMRMNKKQNVVFKNQLESFVVNTYKSDMQQTIINILQNSYDIFKKNDIINPYISVKCFIKNNKIYISFLDNGGGIDEQIIDKVFDPYFTTKHQSKGTGLGLTMVYNFVVNSLHGHVTIKNKNFSYEGVECKGAQLTIEFEQ